MPADSVACVPGVERITTGYVLGARSVFRRAPSSARPNAVLARVRNQNCGAAENVYFCPMKKIMIVDGGPRRNMNTARMRAFLERLAFPWLSYNDYSLTAPKRMPVVLIESSMEHWEEDLQKAFEAGRRLAGV